MVVTAVLRPRIGIKSLSGSNNITPRLSKMGKQSLSSAHNGTTNGSTSRPALKINADRLMETIHHTAQWGAANRYGKGPAGFIRLREATQTGMARLALSDDDARVRRWFADETKNLGCSLTIDEMGNMFARRAGSASSREPMIAMGSHLDTQPRGGRYDGILGVVSAVEALRTLKDAGYDTHFDIGVVNWTNEEGARFPKSMMASGVWAGYIPIEDAWGMKDVFDPTATVKSELERHQMLGPVPCSYIPGKGYPLAAHFELHIEQGPILQEAGKRIGVVKGVQGYRWLTINIEGRDAHTGTTPLDMRKDPLLAAARMISASNDIARRLGALASTGILKIPPTSSTNTVASQASFTLDIRHPSDAVVAQVQDECLKSFNSIAAAEKVRLDWKLDTDSPAVKFDPTCIETVEGVATRLEGPDGWLHMTSGAGHDSAYASHRCPTAMIFVPCKDGVSHNPEEYCSPEDCALGAQALLDAVLDYDVKRAGSSK